MKRSGMPTIGRRFTTLTILVALVIVGFLGLRNYQSKRLAPPTASIAPDPMAGWKVYTNLKYNFSFKYPAGLGGQGSISGPTTGTVEFIRSLTDSKTIRKGVNDYFDGFSVYVVTKPGTTSLEKYISKEIIAMNIAKFTGMRNPAKIQLTNGVALVSVNQKQAYYYLPTPDKKMIVVFAYLQSEPSFKQTFDQILSSFIFTDETSTKVSECLAKTSCTGTVPCMANPASVFCTCMGGEEKIINSVSGQAGICKIDGKEIDEWEYFRSYSQE